MSILPLPVTEGILPAPEQKLQMEDWLCREDKSAKRFVLTATQKGE